MESFKKIMVALDLSNVDEKLLRYSFWLGQSIGVEKIYFLYCAQDLRDLEGDSLQEADVVPLDERIKQNLSEVIEKYNSNLNLEYEIIVDQINPLKGLLYWQDVKKTNLLIVGKKNKSEGSGVISRQFLRHSDCPVLFVPEEAKEEMQNVLIPIDFSENSRLAMQLGVDLIALFDDPQIYCLNIYFTPSEFYQGPEITPHRLLREKVVMDKFTKFIAPYESKKNIRPIFIPSGDSKIIEIISRTAADRNAGLVIIGAIGHSKIKLMTIGSTAEKMMLSDFNVPLLVIRKR